MCLFSGKTDRVAEHFWSICLRCYITKNNLLDNTVGGEEWEEEWEEGEQKKLKICFLGMSPVIFEAEVYRSNKQVDLLRRD